MAGIVMCDRCSRLGKGTALGGIAYRTNISERDNRSVSVEICPECVASFLEWLRLGKHEGARPELSAAPFSEPYRDPADEPGDDERPF